MGVHDLNFNSHICDASGFVKKELHLNASFYTLLRILSVSVFEKTLISCALQPDTTRNIPLPPDNAD